MPAKVTEDAVDASPSDSLLQRVRAMRLRPEAPVRRTNKKSSIVFPDEILEEIADALSGDPQVLRALSLVCKGLEPRSRMHLFRSVKWTYGVSQGLDRLLQTSERIRPLIKHLVIATEGEFVERGKHSDNPRWPVSCYAEYDRILSNLTSLVSITLMPEQYDRYFRINRPHGHFLDFLRNLAAVAQRPGFQWIDATLGMWDDSVVFSMLPRLRHVKLVYGPHDEQNLAPHDITGFAPNPIHSFRAIVTARKSPTLGNDTVATWFNFSSLRLLSYETEVDADSFLSAFAWIERLLVPSYASLQVLVLSPSRYVVNHSELPEGLYLIHLPSLISLRLSFAELYSASNSASWLSRLLSTADPTSLLTELEIILPQSVDKLDPFDEIMHTSGYHQIERITYIDCNMLKSLDDIQKALPKLLSQEYFELRRVVRSDVKKVLLRGFD